LGFLGRFFISERMFAAIDRQNKGYISLEDYLVYNDILSYGSEDEKNSLTFKMIDLRRQTRVNFKDFKEFWMNFIEMYAQSLQVRSSFTEDIIEYAFNEISGESDYFTYEE